MNKNIEISFAGLTDSAMERLYRVALKTQQSVIKVMLPNRAFGLKTNVITEKSKGITVENNIISRMNLATVLLSSGMHVVTFDENEVETIAYIGFDMPMTYSVTYDVFVMLYKHHITALYEILSKAGYNLDILYVELLNTDVAKFLSYTFNSAIGLDTRNQLRILPFIADGNICIDTDVSGVADRFMSEALTMYKNSDNRYADIKEHTSVDESAFNTLSEDWQKDTYMKACSRRIAAQYLIAANNWLMTIFKDGEK